MGEQSIFAMDSTQVCRCNVDCSINNIAQKLFGDQTTFLETKYFFPIIDLVSILSHLYWIQRIIPYSAQLICLLHEMKLSIIYAFITCTFISFEEFVINFSVTINTETYCMTLINETPWTMKGIPLILWLLMICLRAKWICFSAFESNQGWLKYSMSWM